MKQNPTSALLQEISGGESKILEFKSQLPAGEAVAKTLVSFSNTCGGKLIIGVDDNGTVIGLGGADVLELQDKVASIIHDRCAPNILPEIYLENISGQEVLVIEVPRGGLCPYYLKSGGKQQGTHLRIGATNRVADFDMIMELERQRLNRTFDEEINMEVRFEELDYSALSHLFERVGKQLDIPKLKNLKLIKDENGTLYPTHGFLILLGFYEHAEIKCSRFKGVTMEVFIDKKEYRGTLPEQLDQAEIFIKNHLHLKAEIKGFKRIDTFEVPIAAIREAVVNALVHRDYTRFGRDIKIGIYDDIVNIVSPGGLPNSLMVSDLDQGRSEIRNKILARVFKELGYIEQWGSGIQRMKRLCREAGLKEPLIEESGDFINVEFYRQTEPEPVVKEPSYRNYNSAVKEPVSDLSISELKTGYKEGYKKGIILGKNENLIYNEILKDSYITTVMLAKNLKLSTTAVDNNLRKLKEKNLIQRVGPRKGGYWEVIG